MIEPTTAVLIIIALIFIVMCVALARDAWRTTHAERDDKLERDQKLRILESALKEANDDISVIRRLIGYKVESAGGEFVSLSPYGLNLSCKAKLVSADFSCAKRQTQTTPTTNTKSSYKTKDIPAVRAKARAK